ncbi:conserved hypothetical protein [Ricinus communis]|uniref:FAR1 domain-containing protein n=1 Tax=Ricinus communis TaxID=3988 RepID=B9R9F6_RICCO|nr:conserved hypothetical protein [Ricinus communis]
MRMTEVVLVMKTWMSDSKCQISYLNVDHDCRSSNVAHASEAQCSPSSKDDSVAEGILKVGTGFESDEHAYNFYKYARLVGFSVRKDWVNRSKVHGLVVSRKYTCSKEGYRRKALKTEAQVITSSSTPANGSESESIEIFLDEREAEDQDEDRVAKIQEKAGDNRNIKEAHELSYRQRQHPSADAAFYEINMVNSISGGPPPASDTVSKTLLASNSA